MKPAEWKRFAEPALGSGWAFSKGLAYCTPVGWVAHGVLAERSGEGGFYLWAVRLPLYYPTEVVVLDWSERIGGGTKVWNTSPEIFEVLRKEGNRIQAETKSCGSVLLVPPGGADNISMQETRAYGLVLEGHVDAAIEVLGRVLRYEPKYDWEHVMVARSRGVREQLISGAVDDVLALLSIWRSESARTVGISLEV